MRVVSLPRRVYTLIVGIVLLIVTACLIVSFREESWGANNWRIPFTTDDGEAYLNENPNDNGKTRIALMETGGTHDEVSAALLYAFGAMKNAELTTFFRAQRYEMKGIMDKFELETPIVQRKKAHEFSKTVRDWTPHIIVATTCEFDAKNEADSFRKLLKHADTHLFCFIHHADRWVNNKWSKTASEFHKKGRLDIVGLSQHTIDYFTENSAPHWDGGRPIPTRVLPPVFPVDTPEVDPAANLSLAMQGDYSSDRRDYKSIFNALGDVIKTVEDYRTLSDADDVPETVDLHVIGHGKPPAVPKEVEDRVFFDSSLSYPNFYGMLSQAYSILPSFANDEYYDRKASSSVPASLIAGAPLVANDKLLAAYSYLPRNATWYQKEGESEMDVIKRVISERDVYLEKREAVRLARESIMAENMENAVEWMEEALKRRKWTGASRR